VAVTEEILRLARQLQACETRLSLLRNGDDRWDEMRRDLEHQRDLMTRRLAQLEAAEGWNDPTNDDVA
jgi:hypothetical protein